LRFGCYFVRISSESLTRAVAHRYLDAWTSGDLDRVRPLLAADVQVESNVGDPGWPARQIDALAGLADYLDKVDLMSEVYETGRAVLVYDCLVRGAVDQIRLVEFLDLEGDLVHRIRRVFDVVALRRLIPEFDL
jgi:hypothetical protein